MATALAVNRNLDAYIGQPLNVQTQANIVNTIVNDTLATSIVGVPGNNAFINVDSTGFLTGTNGTRLYINNVNGGRIAVGTDVTFTIGTSTASTATNYTTHNITSGTGFYVTPGVTTGIATGTIVINNPINIDTNGWVHIVSNGTAVTANDISWNPLDKKAHMRQYLRNRLLIKQGAEKSLSRNVSPQELKARNLLRDMLTEKEWRRYLTNGFIMVPGKSGKWYQIFNKSAGYSVQVYEKNVRIASLCIHTVQDCPPTDHVINMKVLVELDEEQIYKGANVSRYDNHVPVKRSPVKVDTPSLVEYYNKLKNNQIPMYYDNTTNNTITITNNYAVLAA